MEIAQRIAGQPGGSCTAQLHAEGPRRKAQKVGEEGVGLALAAATGDDAEVLAEAADLLFHMTPLLRQRGLAAYASTDAQRLPGQRSCTIEKPLGYRGPDELIHRGDLVLTDDLGPTDD